MRPLTTAQADRCENAQSPPNRCRCRCGGRCHGRALVSGGELLAALPADDPHHAGRDRGRELVGVQTTIDPELLPERPIYRRRAG